ncbi:MAG TPA: hypothetical protein VFB60_29525 [Ktedonobacteraceae bacterium]|nr:hypothetical protein [Ktedonobacteraceae bacterium]
MQPSSPDPTNSTGQLSSSSQSEKLSMTQSSDSPGSTDQPYPLSPYPQTESPVAPPPPLGSYPPGEEAYYGQLAQGGPITQYRAQLQEKIGEPAKPKRNGWKIIATILAVLVLILATTTTTLLLTHPSVQQTGQTTSLPVATQTVQPVPTLVTTQAAQPTSTSVATQSAPVATVPSGTITENLLLTCGTNCNDPIRVTITTIQVNAANGNMIWNISLQNVSGSSMGYGVDTFELLASGAQNQIPANVTPKSDTLANSDPVKIQAIFAFVPTQNTTYTLTVAIQENPFMGPTINFDPVQITNL